MKSSRFHITDHAVVRYLERVKGVDMKAVRREIAKAVQIAEDHPTACGVLKGGHSYKLSGNTITTVLNPNMRPAKPNK